MHDREPDMPNEILGPCPPWCEGVHNPRQGWGQSQFHSTEPLYLDLELGGVVYRIGEADVTQYPNATDPLQRLPFLFLELDFDDYELGPEDFAVLAAALAGFMEQVRQLSDRVAVLRTEHYAAMAWRT